MRISILGLISAACTHAINLVVLYEKTGLRDTKEMYRYVVEKLLEKFNNHLQRRGIRIELIDFLTYDDYQSKPEYFNVAIAGGEEKFDARIEALKDVPANVVFVASANSEEKFERYVFNSPCASIFVSNVVSKDNTDDESLARIVYAILGWMGNFFGMTAPNPAKEKGSEAFDRFAKNASAPEFIEALKKCSKETRGQVGKFSFGVSSEDEGDMYTEHSRGGLNTDWDVEISSPLRWVLHNSPEENSKNHVFSGKRTDKQKRAHRENFISGETTSRMVEESDSDSTDRAVKEKKGPSERGGLQQRNKSRGKKVKKTGGMDIEIKSGKTLDENVENEDILFDEKQMKKEGKDGAEKMRNSAKRNRKDLQAEIEKKIKEELQKLVWKTQGFRNRKKIRKGEPSEVLLGQTLYDAEQKFENEEDDPQTPSQVIFGSATLPRGILKTADGLSYGRIPYRQDKFRQD